MKEKKVYMERFRGRKGKGEIMSLYYKSPKMKEIILKVYVYECISTQAFRYPQRPDPQTQAPRAGVTGGCELPKVDVENRTQILCKSGLCL